MEILLGAVVLAAVLGLIKNTSAAVSEGEWGELPLNGCGLILGAVVLILIFGALVMGGAALEAFDQDIANMVTNGTSAGTPKYDAFWQERCADYRARGLSSTVCDRKGW